MRSSPRQFGLSGLREASRSLPLPLLISLPEGNHWDKHMEIPCLHTALLAWEGSGRVTQKAACQKRYMKQLTGNLLCSCSSCCQAVLDQVHLPPVLPTDRTIGKKRGFFAFLKKKKKDPEANSSFTSDEIVCSHCGFFHDTDALAPDRRIQSALSRAHEKARDLFSCCILHQTETRSHVFS